MSPTKKTKFHHGDLRNALLVSAKELLDSEGENGVTIRAVARKTGVSHAAPVNHFADRKALLTALSVVLFEELHTSIKASISKQQNKEERVHAFVNSCVIYGLSHPERYKLLWRQELFETDNPALQAVMNCLYADFMETLSGLVDETKCDLNTVAVTLWSMFHGYTSMRLNGMFEPMTDTHTNEARHEAMFRSYIKSLRN